MKGFEQTFAGVFHDINTKLDRIIGKDLTRCTLFRAFAKAMAVDECTVAAFCIL